MYFLKFMTHCMCILNIVFCHGHQWLKIKNRLIQHHLIPKIQNRCAYLGIQHDLSYLKTKSLLDVPFNVAISGKARKCYLHIEITFHKMEILLLINKKVIDGEKGKNQNDWIFNIFLTKITVLNIKSPSRI